MEPYTDMLKLHEQLRQQGKRNGILELICLAQFVVIVVLAYALAG